MAALAPFYLTGQAWATHGPAANATMIDSDNVLLLEEVDGVKPVCVRSALGDRDGDAPQGRYEVRVHHIGEAGRAVDTWLSSVVPELREAGAELIGAFRTHHAENTFPKLPVRTDVEALVVLTRYESDDALNTAKERMRTAANHHPRPLEALQTQPAEILRLTPTSRSSLR